MRLPYRRRDGKHLGRAGASVLGEDERIAHLAVKPLNVKTIVKTASAFLCLLYLLLQCQSISIIRRFLTDEELVYGFQQDGGPRYHPKISLVAVWAGKDQPNYMTWFLESIARQPDEVELVLIQRGRSLMDIKGTIASRARNIKVVQMSDDRCESNLDERQQKEQKENTG
jgi:hypothetical protein